MPLMQLMMIVHNPGQGYVKYNCVYVYQDKRYHFDRFGRRIEKSTFLENNLEHPIAKTEFHWQGMLQLKEI